VEMMKLLIPQFNANIIYLGSSRSYKKPKFLKRNSAQNVLVPRESVYDAEMYRVMVNWLVYSFNIEITGQWHLEFVGQDGGYHHSYCDLSLKYPDDEAPFAILELLATASTSNLKKHVDQILSYANQLHPKELWIIHFYKTDNISPKPFWPDDSLLEKGLGMIHIWHNEYFTEVKLSAKFLFNNEIKIIKDYQIL
jgi:hypothetical protein